MPIPTRPRAWPKPDAVRLSVFYALTMAGTGVSAPYAAAWFGWHGLSGAEIGLVLGAPMFARLFTSPALALWADSFRLRRTSLMIFSGVVAVAYLGVALSKGLATWLALWLVAASAQSMIAPLTDVLTLRRGRREGFTFGPARGVGSLAFIVGNVVMGLVLNRASIEVVMWWLVAAAAGMAVAARLALPAEPVRDRGPASRADRFRGMGRLVADPVFMLAIVSVGLINSTHAFYYSFSTLAWAAQGFSKGVIGLLWAAGVAAEIVFLWFLGPLRRRLGPWRLLALSAIGAIVRWTALAFAPPLWLVWPLQTLHSLTFTASYLGGLELVERLSPPDSQSAAQTLSSTLSAGAIIGPATLLSGVLYDRYGALGYLAMSFMAVIGLGGVLLLRRLALSLGVPLDGPAAPAASGGVAEGRFD